MKGDSVLRLKDKTAVVAGPLSSVTRSILTVLTENGADVVLLGPGGNEARRFCENLSEAREANEAMGQAVAAENPLQSPSDAADGISKAAETFGGVDIFIDAHLEPRAGSSWPETTLALTDSALKFLQGRGKGRLLYLVYDESLSLLKGEMALRHRMGLSAFAKGYARESGSDHITINCLSIGVTEEFLLRRHPQATSIKLALEELHKVLPHARLVDTTAVANVVAFLSSPLSSAITGQTIAANAGL